MRWFRPLAAALALWGPPAIAQSSCPPDGALDGAALEAVGAVVGSLVFVRRNVFDTDLPEESGAFYRAANRLHRVTRAEAIERQLLLRPGQAFSQRLMEESARLLRASDTLRDAELRVVDCTDGEVTLEVDTRDVWSLNPGLAGGRKGGESNFRLDLEEGNLFGTGALLRLSRRSDAERSGTAVRYRDRHQFRPYLGLDLQFADNSDGGGWALAVEQPFYALDTRRAYGLSFDRLGSRESFYDRGEEVAEYRQRNRDLDLWWGLSPGLLDGRVWRFSAGLRDQRRRFLPSLDPQLLGPLPEDRALSGPWVGFEHIRDRWEVLRNYDQIDTAEDVLLGARISARLGRSAELFGADQQAWWMESEFSRGHRFAGGSLLRFMGSAEARHEQGETRNLSLRGDLRYYLPTGPRRLLFAELQGQYGRELDLDNRIYLGGDSGLRGYPLRWVGGESYARLSVEQRYFTDWYPWRLFRVGGAVFADVGRVWGSDPLGRPNPGLLADVGLGLRLSNTRSSFARLIHIDLALPLDKDPSLKRVELVLEARRAF